ncbi:MAG TPA: hypothetical protein ENN05_09085 [Deltaproteobacteria bacterium]|nr:hypothetical protein [Deltaproteobacteria bacterium]
MDRPRPKDGWLGRRVKTTHTADREGVVVGFNEHCVIIDYDDLTPPEHEPYKNLIPVEGDDTLDNPS